MNIKELTVKSLPHSILTTSLQARRQASDLAVCPQLHAIASHKGSLQRQESVTLSQHRHTDNGQLKGRGGGGSETGRKGDLQVPREGTKEKQGGGYCYKLYF